LIGALQMTRVIHVGPNKIWDAADMNASIRKRRLPAGNAQCEFQWVLVAAEIENLRPSRKTK
jgi:hypothetical protein